jgi:subtilisin family serine protease
MKAALHIVAFLVGFVGASGTLLGQSGGVLTADKSLAVVSTPTTITFALQLPTDPNLLTTSPNLQRLGATGWVVVGRLYDDGTHGDAIAGDNRFSLQVVLNEPQTGAVSFRASSGNKKSLVRKFSNTVQVNIVEPLSLSVQSGSQEVFVIQGDTINVVTTITVANSGFGSVNIQNAVTISPSDGISMTSDYPSGGWNTSSSQTFVLNQQFDGLAVGDYLVENTATITGHGIFASDSFVVHVLPPGGDPIILPLGSFPDGVQINVPTQVLFTASIANHLEPPDHLDLRMVDGTTDPVVGELRDDGTGGDLQAGDGVYSGLGLVTAPTEGVVQLRASGQFPGVPGERTSTPFQLVVTCFPTSVAPSDMSKIVLDPETQQQMICNEVLVAFTEPKTCAEVEAFASAFDAAVVGTLPGLGVYQMTIPNPACTLAVLNSTLTAMADKPGVAVAAPNLVATVDEVTPNDPQYVTQYAPQNIRADEAWVIARGGPVIAIIDTGVDYNHEDLAGKVIQGHDFVNGDDDPIDDHGHGTHCAGIAAASGNNGKGVAGIAWDSSILAIKVADAAGRITFANGTAGIKSAADLGAKVISCSWGYTPTVLNKLQAWLAGLESAVNYATTKGAIVVAAAGNEGSTAIRLPGYYANAFCVGSTTSTDGRSSFSNYGPEVDIAAPGSAILSTLNGGGYGIMSGTSMATPCVSGAIAVLWSRFPAYTAAQIRERLQKTAVELPGLQLGAGRVDLFEAVFNGSFEDGINGWTATGTAGAVSSLGPLTPTDRKNFGFASSGPDAAQVQTTLEQSFTIQPGVSTFKISFDYDFVTEEYPEFVGSIFDDNMRIQLITPSGETHELAFESINSSSFTLIGGIDFPGGDDTVGHTGWKTVTTTVPVTQGPGNYRIIVRDEGDGIYDSNVLIDRIRFK